MNKNSQYTNSCNVNISEMARLTFQEHMPQLNGEIAHVITVSMHVNFLKTLHDTIGSSLAQHMETVANVGKNKDLQ